MKIILLCCTAAVIFCLWGAPLFAADDKPEKDGPEETGGYSDPSRPIVVLPGEKCSLTIASNVTTGYSWQLAKPIDEKIIKLSGSRYIAPNTGLMGAPGREVWTFVALSPGQTTVFLKYTRPWEKDSPPAREASFTIIVK